MITPTSLILQRLPVSHADGIWHLKLFILSLCFSGWSLTSPYGGELHNEVSLYGEHKLSVFVSSWHSWWSHLGGSLPARVSVSNSNNHSCPCLLWGCTYGQQYRRFWVSRPAAPSSLPTHLCLYRKEGAVALSWLGSSTCGAAHRATGPSPSLWLGIAVLQGNVTSWLGLQSTPLQSPGSYLRWCWRKPALSPLAAEDLLMLATLTLFEGCGGRHVFCWSGTHYIDQVGHNVTDSLVSASKVLWLKAHATILTFWLIQYHQTFVN